MPQTLAFPQNIDLSKLYVFTAGITVSGAAVTVQGGLTVTSNHSQTSGTYSYNSSGSWTAITSSGAELRATGTSTNLILSNGTTQASRWIHASTASGTLQIGFLGASPVARQNVTGSRGGNAALASLCSALANLGLITNSTSA